MSSKHASIQVVNLIRFGIELIAFVTLGIWGFTQFREPWSIVVGLGAPGLAIVVWALFRSPRAVFAIDRFGTALIDIAIFTAATLSMLDLPWPWGFALVYAVVAALTGLASGLLGGTRAEAPTAPDGAGLTHTAPDGAGVERESGGA